MFPFEPLKVYSLFDSVLPTSTGIYAICNVLNAKYYIGSARAFGRWECEVGFRGRFIHHRRQLRNNNHHCQYLQNSYNYYVGELGYNPNDIYQIWILEYAERDRCLQLEQDYFDFYKPQYNDTLTAVGGFMLGRNHTPESCKKIGDAARGNKYNVGRKPSPETLARMSAAQQNKILSESTRMKISLSRIGIEFSDQHIENLSKAHIGNKSAKRQAYVAISPEGEFTYFVNARAFCDSEFGKKHKFSRSKISDCAKGKRPYHRNFQFLYVDDLFEDAA